MIFGIATRSVRCGRSSIRFRTSSRSGSAVRQRSVGEPQLSVWEDEHAVYAEADLPGVDPAKLEITVTEGTQLTVQGERTPPEVAGAAWVRQERPFGKFTRAVSCRPSWTRTRSRRSTRTASCG